MMSIHFRFASKPCTPDEAWPLLEDAAMAYQKIHPLVTTERGDNELTLHLCTLGEITLSYRLGMVQGDCQTNLAGAGFHAAAVECIEFLSQETNMDFAIEDETEYAEHRDFARMKDQHFFSWLRNVVDVLKDYRAQNNTQSICVAWDVHKYLPYGESNTIVTPLGMHHSDALFSRVRQHGIESFAEVFYVWPYREQNALFFRNSALNLLWEDCYFMPSARSEADAVVNTNIIALLEKSMTLDPKLPQPLDAYVHLCELAEHAPIDVQSIPVFRSDYAIGYRREKLQFHVGNLGVSIPGHYLYEQQREDRDHVWFDGRGHSVRISAFTGSEERTEFDDALFFDATELPRQFAVGSGKGKAYFAPPVRDREGNTSYQVVGEILSGKQVSLVTISFPERSEREWAFGIVQSVILLPDA